MPNEVGVTRNEILSTLARSSHGKLHEYQAIIGAACSADPEFVAHVIAWDFVNGQIKDSKIALPVITLADKRFPDALVENSLAHLAMADPRQLLKALEFSIATGTPARRQRQLEKTIHRYLRNKESIPGKWDRLVARHRRTVKALYAKTHSPAPEWVSRVLYGFRKGEDGQVLKLGYAPGSIFSDIAMLHAMSPTQAAATIQKWHLSPLVVTGAMTGSKEAQKSGVVVQAGMDQMSDTELVTRAKSLERAGVGKDAVLKEKFRGRVAKAKSSKKATLKTSVAAEEMEDDSLKAMLHELQERQIAEQKAAGRGIDGNWLVIADKSQSQEVAIELGRHVAAAIAKFVTGRVWLAFCDSSGVGKEVTGWTLDAIRKDSEFVRASGSTSYGVGLQWAMHKGFELDGIVIVGDGGENTSPSFASAYQAYRSKKEVPIYFLQTFCPAHYARTEGGNPALFEASMRRIDVPVTKHDLTHGQVDYYSIPNIVQTFNANSFGMVEKVMACPLVTLDMVLPIAKGAA